MEPFPASEADPRDEHGLPLGDIAGRTVSHSVTGKPLDLFTVAMLRDVFIAGMGYQRLQLREAEALARAAVKAKRERSTGGVNRNAPFRKKRKAALALIETCVAKDGMSKRGAMLHAERVVGVPFKTIESWVYPPKKK